jgi:hypothetical protein
MKIKAGETVIVILHTPREKLIGIIDEISVAGVHFRGLDLGYFEDWTRSIASGEPQLSMSEYFLPMWRVERITRDESIGEMPSMEEQFKLRTGRELGEF